MAYNQVNNDAKTNGELLNKRAVASLLGVSPRTVDAWMRSRRLSYYKIGRTVRFTRTAVEACLAKFEIRSA